MAVARRVAVALFLIAGIVRAQQLAPSTQPSRLHALGDIHMRDPFVLPVREEGKYYLYGTIFTLKNGPGFVVYSSKDLIHWEGPDAAFRRPGGFWGDHDFWAPEVHHYHDKFYMLASFAGRGHERGTAVLVSDHPQGPFQPHSKLAITPSSDSCLDGT